MKEIFKDPDIFKVKLVQQQLRQNGVEAVVMDEHTGALYHGIGTMMPRLMVIDEDFDAAVAFIKELEV
ncbi:MAG: DUF2007 domain-containing protein [Pseudomonadota bacterium]